VTHTVTGFLTAVYDRDGKSAANKTWINYIS